MANTIETSVSSSGEVTVTTTSTWTWVTFVLDSGALGINKIGFGGSASFRPVPGESYRVRVPPNQKILITNSSSTPETWYFILEDDPDALGNVQAASGMTQMLAIMRFLVREYVAWLGELERIEDESPDAIAAKIQARMEADRQRRLPVNKLPDVVRTHFRSKQDLREACEDINALLGDERTQSSHPVRKQRVLNPTSQRIQEPVTRESAQAAQSADLYREVREIMGNAAATFTKRK